MIMRKIITLISFEVSFNSIFDIFYLKGEPISVHLLRYSGIRGEIPHLHPLSLESAPISTRE